MRRLALTLALAGLLLAACGGPGVVESPLPTPQVLPPAQQRAFEASRDALAKELGVAPATIQLVQVTPQDWPDGCLGLGGAAESCLAAITPGYLVTLEAGGEQYEVRTNQDATAVRVDL
jgi:hypothetical protein